MSSFMDDLNKRMQNALESSFKPVDLGTPDELFVPAESLTDDALIDALESLADKSEDQTKALRGITVELRKRVSVAEQELKAHQQEIIDAREAAKRATFRSWIAIAISVVALLVEIIARAC